MSRTRHARKPRAEKALSGAVGERDAMQARIDEALDYALRFGGIDGEHHKTWVIARMVRSLTGASYAEWVKNAKAGEDGPDTYGWDEGIAP